MMRKLRNFNHIKISISLLLVVIPYVASAVASTFLYEEDEYKVTLHQLIYIWEDVRCLHHLFAVQELGYSMVDTIADQLMKLHELIIDNTKNPEQLGSAELWTACMNMTNEIMYHVYVLEDAYKHEAIAHLHADVHDLHTAIKNQLYTLWLYQE